MDNIVAVFAAEFLLLVRINRCDRVEGWEHFLAHQTVEHDHHAEHSKGRIVSARRRDHGMFWFLVLEKLLQIHGISPRIKHVIVAAANRHNSYIRFMNGDTLPVGLEEISE